MSNPARLPSRAEAVAWHSLPLAELAARVEGDVELGLTTERAAERLARVGPNALPEAERSSLFLVLLRQFKSPLIYLLLVAAAIAAALGELKDAVVIVVVVLLNAVIGAIQEGRAERSLQALRKLARLKARVVRAGRELLVDAAEIVPGDVLLLSAGDAVAADARLVEGASLHVAEAALTGESVPVAKGPAPLAEATVLADRKNMVYSGTYATAGRGKALVVATGLSTEIGRIASMAESAVATKTPLERRIDQFGRYVIYAAIVIFGLVVGIGYLRGVPFAEIFMIGVSQIVGMVPEGLPVAMTIALAVGVQRMARRRAVVRRLSAVETLGSTTVICTDKTGTLTRNEMTVQALVLPDGREVSVTGVGYAPEGTFRTEGREVTAGHEPALRELLEAMVLCNDAQLERGEAATGSGAGEPAQAWRPLGDPTEVALLSVAMKGAVVPAELRAQYRRVDELPFDSATKVMATAHAGNGKRFLVVKGAPEVILGNGEGPSAAGLLGTGGRVADWRGASERLAAQAMRVLAVAVVDDARFAGEGLSPERGLEPFLGRARLLGLVGQVDPPRLEVAGAVKACQSAGIRPVMVTGDHKATGLAIARELGIAREDREAVDGVELEAMNEEELARRIEDFTVFARVHPAQKLRIVEAYQKRGEVVAMTGDGVNDAPALVRADVGVAMGITGTEVAKDAAKIVIADDDFATIVAAVEEGRVVYRNIKKAVLLLFSTSAAEVVILMMAMLLGYPPPFAAVQILWNNLVTEGVITVNLVMEPPEGDEMRRPPIPPDEPLLTRILVSRMALMTATISAVTLGWLIARRQMGVSPAQVQTEAFTLLAVCEWFNVLNCRSEWRSALNLGILQNRWLLGGLVVGNLLQVAVVFWPPFNGIFRTVPIGWREALAVAAVGSAVLWVEELRKLVVRRREARLAG